MALDLNDPSAAAPTLTGITVQGNQLLLQFSKAITSTDFSSARSRFTVKVGGNTRNLKTLAAVSGDPTRLSLSLDGSSAPIASQEVSLSYSDATDTRGVIRDTDGNRLASIITPLSSDTFSSASTVNSLNAAYTNLLLTDKIGDQVQLVGDDLFTCQPIAAAIGEQGCNFILTCRPASHKTVAEYLYEIGRAHV